MGMIIYCHILILSAVIFSQVWTYFQEQKKPQKTCIIVLIFSLNFLIRKFTSKLIADNK